VPAYFNDAQRQATKDADALRDWKFCGWSMSLRRQPWPMVSTRKKLLRLRFTTGRGTFDISILKLHEGIFEVIAHLMATPISAATTSTTC